MKKVDWSCRRQPVPRVISSSVGSKADGWRGGTDGFCGCWVFGECFVGGLVVKGQG